MTMLKTILSSLRRTVTTSVMLAQYGWQSGDYGASWSTLSYQCVLAACSESRWVVVYGGHVYKHRGQVTGTV